MTGTDVDNNSSQKGDFKQDAEKRNSGKAPSNFLRYSGMATQMLGTILIFTYAGYKLDQWQMNKTPAWTLVLSLTSIAASLYLLIRSMPRIK